MREQHGSEEEAGAVDGAVVHEFAAAVTDLGQLARDLAAHSQALQACLTICGIAVRRERGAREQRRLRTCWHMSDTRALKRSAAVSAAVLLRCAVQRLTALARSRADSRPNTVTAMAVVHRRTAASSLVVSHVACIAHVPGASAFSTPEFKSANCGVLKCRAPACQTPSEHEMQGQRYEAFAEYHSSVCTQDDDSTELTTRCPGSRAAARRSCWAQFERHS